MKTYIALEFGTAFVETRTAGPGGRYELPPRLDLRNHSPSGYAWGYGGSGPAQLALAILCDAFDDETAVSIYQEFKRRAVATRAKDAAFVMTIDEVKKIAEEIRENRCSRNQPSESSPPSP